jgi:hypothetical protein
MDEEECLDYGLYHKMHKMEEAVGMKVVSQAETFRRIGYLSEDFGKHVVFDRNNAMKQWSEPCGTRGEEDLKGLVFAIVVHRLRNQSKSIQRLLLSIKRHRKCLNILVVLLFSHYIGGSYVKIFSPNAGQVCCSRPSQEYSSVTSTLFPLPWSVLGLQE